MSFDAARLDPAPAVGVDGADPAGPGGTPGPDGAPGPGETPGAGGAPGSAVAPGPARWTAGRAVLLLLAAALVVTGVRSFVAEAFVVPSASMLPLLHTGDRVVVSRLDYRLGDIRRGDVIVFDGNGVFDPQTTPARNPLVAAGRAVAAALGASTGEHDYVKRVIGLPGERIKCCDASGRLLIDGVPLTEPYLHGAVASSIPFDVGVPAGRYFVLGDNRDDSADSRAHLGDPGGGTVPADHVIGRVVAIWWPWAHAVGIGRPTFSVAATSSRSSGGAS